MTHGFSRKNSTPKSYAGMVGGAFRFLWREVNKTLAKIALRVSHRYAWLQRPTLYIWEACATTRTRSIAEADSDYRGAKHTHVAKPQHFCEPTWQPQSALWTLQNRQSSLKNRTQCRHCFIVTRSRFGWEGPLSEHATKSQSMPRDQKQNKTKTKKKKISLQAGNCPKSMCAVSEFLHSRGM